MSIEASVIDEIRERADIVDVISQYVSLKRAGARYKGLCPFHAEKSPSFTVNPELQIFKCFGCGAGGNVFTFLMSQTQQGFSEVVRELARQYGVRLVFSEEEQGAEQFRVILRRINQEASLYFQWLLKHPQQGEEARAYLAARGIEPYTQQRFALGYAANSWNTLFEHLKTKGFAVEELEKSGLFKRYEQREGLYDIFRHRVIFPIVGVNGDVLAFGGRALESDTGAKYINSPETEIYIKGQHIYALNLAKQAIRKQDRVILMEGYLDVISAHQHGFEEAVAGLGTALTQTQARQLLRFSESKTIYMAYDADAAGQKATDKGVEVLEQAAGGAPLRLHVLAIPDQEDPDTFLRKFGAPAFEELLAQARSYTAYYLDKLIGRHDLSNPVDKSMAAKAGIAALLKMPDPVLRDEYLRYLADRLEIDEGALREQMQQHGRKGAAPFGKRQQGKGFKREGRFEHAQPAGPPPAPLPLRDIEFISELGLLHLMLKFPEQAAAVVDEIRPMVFADPGNEDLRLYLVSMAEAGLEVPWQDLFVAFPEMAMHQRLSEMMENPAFQSLDFDKSLADFSRNVKLKSLGIEMERLSAEIQQAEQEADRSRCHDLMQRYMELMQTLTRLKQSGH
ncbi:MAG: DNA primase [Candidatus Sericytochromatia bacterium]